MQRRINIQIPSLLVIFSILTIILQIATYCIFHNFYIVLGICAALSILCCHILCEQSASYGICFNYSILTMFISLIITVLTYYHKDYSFLPNNSLLIGIIVVNWLIPILHCFIRYMLDYGSRLEDYPSFYRNSSILFFLVYLLILIYGSLAKDTFPWAYQTVSDTFNFIPFQSLSSQINEFLYKDLPINNIIIYLCSRILIFVPYGFFCELLMRRRSFVLRFLVLLVLPVIMEAFQGILISSRGDIDDIIYGLIGGVLGTLCFYLVNFIFCLISGKNFLEKDAGYYTINHSLHF